MQIVLQRQVADHSRIYAALICDNISTAVPFDLDAGSFSDVELLSFVALFPQSPRLCSGTVLDFQRINMRL